MRTLEVMGHTVSKLPFGAFYVTCLIEAQAARR